MDETFSSAPSSFCNGVKAGTFRQKELLVVSFKRWGLWGASCSDGGGHLGAPVFGSLVLKPLLENSLLAGRPGV